MIFAQNQHKKGGFSRIVAITIARIWLSSIYLVRLIKPENFYSDKHIKKIPIYSIIYEGIWGLVGFNAYSPGTDPN